MITENRKSGVIRITKESTFAFLVAVAFCHSTLFSYFEIIIGKLPVVSVFKPLFFPLLYMILILMVYSRERTKYIRLWDFGIILFFALSISLTIVVYPQNEKYILDALGEYILPCIPFFLLGLCFSFDEKTADIVSNICCVAIIVSTLYVFYYMNTGRSILGSSGDLYSMYWSYLLLPNTMVAINYAFKKRKLMPICCSIVGVFYAFSMGTRGPIVLLFALIVIMFWKYLNSKISWKIFITLLIVGFAVYYVTSGKYMLLLQGFRTILSNNGASTRIIDYLIKGEMVSYTSGRMDIYIDLLERLNDRFLIGYGVYGEWQFGYYSAHNMYLEAVFHFGWIIGSIMILLYALTYFRTIKIFRRNSVVMDWLIIFGLMVFVKGIFGGRYMDKYVFFLLGMCLNLLRKHKRSKTEEFNLETNTQ